MRTRGKNYNAIECVAAVAATLNVFEMGDTEGTKERNQLCAQKYLQHIDHLFAGTEMELTPNPFAPWPRWPQNVSVEDAKKRAERPDLVWKRGTDTIMECRKYEGILTTCKQGHGVTTHQAGKGKTLSITSRASSGKQNKKQRTRQLTSLIKILLETLTSPQGKPFSSQCHLIGQDHSAFLPGISLEVWETTIIISAVRKERGLICATSTRAVPGSQGPSLLK
jgi:hypothetical protein